MAGKGAKKRNSKDSTTGSKEKKKGGKKKNGRSTGGSSAKSSKIQGDIFSEGAMENAYLICHNVQDVLKARGFPWPEAKKKKGKRK
ncbi:small lysine-rich protein 1 [Sitodiplosis mosellana]|uniref:small lysine-rich protein 1 n=1 Tax=Sitodiplosis mosellana TaxID=263140 RepID=UPI002443EB3A|nr:small lysine-rich protein 1 [Sitodiplosis mosellana]